MKPLFKKQVYRTNFYYAISRKERKIISAKNSHLETSVANQGYRSQGPTNYRLSHQVVYDPQLRS